MAEFDAATLEKTRKDILRTTLGLYKAANAGHIGASLSCLEILTYLHFFRMHADDKFILSKGHAAAALYATLHRRGDISDAELATYYKDNTHLAAHPPCSRAVKGIIFGTGSLGHGLSLATGLYLSRKFTGRDFSVYAVLSEGDCDEGSTWEAALLAAQHKMSGLTVIVDNNGLQGFGQSGEIMNLEPLADKWSAFNFDVAVAEHGNDFSSLHEAFGKLQAMRSDRPKCLIARTVKGHGLPFMENRMESHYLPLTDEQYAWAMQELSQ